MQTSEERCECLQHVPPPFQDRSRTLAGYAQGGRLFPQVCGKNSYAVPKKEHTRSHARRHRADERGLQSCCACLTAAGPMETCTRPAAQSRRSQWKHGIRGTGTGYRTQLGCRNGAAAGGRYGERRRKLPDAGCAEPGTSAGHRIPPHERAAQLARTRRSHSFFSPRALLPFRPSPSRCSLPSLR
ncbi:hypothetical protein FQA47_008630 [Oryzias melastigma]|uniref:Uncharacterized protein n=1 Tax=Oryzias melastigma TaxID=30732 RepID=A0A834F0H8_ORYME|nr:hypothetical protein FQA47_008630 [Oryzias melastigma]